MSGSINTALHPYFNFPGNGVEVMAFYHSVFGGELNSMPFAGTEMETPENKNRLMHATLVAEGITLMASDSQPGEDVTLGTNVSLSINCKSRKQADDFFTKLSDGGKVTMPLQDTFWGAYFGMCTDKYGTHWMFNYDEPK